MDHRFPPLAPQDQTRPRAVARSRVMPPPSQPIAEWLAFGLFILFLTLS